MSQAQTEKTADLADSWVDQLATVIKGKRSVIELAAACVIAGGHLLLDDVPGVGKTTLARAIAKSTGATFSRIQFTSDLLPADILGVNVFTQKDGNFNFRPGPIFANIVLADEINRTTPRTQSCLLQAMSESRVSIDDETHLLPHPFLVIATQNPIEAHGTYPLPESQMDRFLMRLTLGYPSQEVERQILVERRREEPLDSLESSITTDVLLDLQKKVDNVRVDESLVDYAMAVIESTRSCSRLNVGVSVRGGLNLLQAARALALVRGRDFVVPDDLRDLFGPVLAHRVSMAGVEGTLGDARRGAEGLIDELVSEIEVPI